MSDVLAYTAGDIFVAAAPWSALKSNDVIRTDYQPGERKVPVMWIYGDQVCNWRKGKMVRTFYVFQKKDRIRNCHSHRQKA